MAATKNLSFADLLPDRKKKKVERKFDTEQIQVPEGSRKLRKRKGRGHASGMGKTASRGENGQKSRSGYSMTPGFEGGQMPLHRRVPKRGFRSINPTDFQLVNLFRLEKSGLSGDITPLAMVKSGLIRDTKRLVKILGTGEIKSSFKITADAFTQSARKKIEAAGGTCSERDLNSEKKAAKTAASKKKKD